jgi:hypothetical protein
MTVRAWIDKHFEGEALLADGFDDALIGWAYSPGRGHIAVYDAEKCIQILEARDGMSREEACDYFVFNTEGSWVGEKTPVYLWRIREEDDDDDDFPADAPAA